MSVNLSHRIYLFTWGCCFLFAAIVVSILWSSQIVELAFSRDSYAKKVDNQTNILEQFVVSDNIYDSDYNAENWLDLQKKLSNLLELSPKLTPHQQTIQNSINSQNNSLRRLFKKITDTPLIYANVAIKSHLKARLLTQLEAIRSDSNELSALAAKDIYSTITKEILFIVALFLVTIFVTTQPK